jgi:integrase
MQHEHSQEITFSRLLLEFEAKHPDLEEGTQYMRRLGFDYLIATVGDKSIADFRLEDAEAFRAALLTRWKPVTAASYLKMVRPPFRWWQYQEKSFLDFWADLPKIKVPKTKPKMYSDGEVKAILAGADGDDLMRPPFFQTHRPGVPAKTTPAATPTAGALNRRRAGSQIAEDLVCS